MSTTNIFKYSSNSNTIDLCEQKQLKIDYEIIHTRYLYTLQSLNGHHIHRAKFDVSLHAKLIYHLHYSQQQKQLLKKD